MITPPGAPTSVLVRLRALCGEDAARPGAAADEVLGKRPRWVVAPHDTAQVCDVLQYAVALGMATLVRGTGHRLSWGPAPTAVDLVLDTSRLSRVDVHPDGETAVVGAGGRLDRLASRFAEAGRRLPLDPPGPVTLGGALAHGVDGPLRMRYGGAPRLVRELVLVRGDGTVTRTGGGRLSELAAGGFGGLGVVTEAAVSLHPVPPVRRWIVRTVASPAEVRLLAGVIEHYPEVAAVEVHNPYGPGQGPDLIGVLLEGSPELVRDRLPPLCGELAGEDGAGITVYPRPPAWWDSYPFAADDIALRITTPPSQLYSAGYIIRDAAGETPVRTRWSPGVAVMYAGLPGDTEPARVARMLEGVRQTLIARDGSCVVLDAPPAVRAAVDMWGPAPDPEALRRLKAEYDPGGILAPGRFPTT